MNLFIPCFLCLKSKENCNKILCSNCKTFFEQHKFYACPRCSRVDCSGCSKLTEFTRIYCLYTYNNIFSKIIVNAKDKFHINFQQVFEEIFYFPIKSALIDMFKHHEYDTIILSPFHKRRMFHGYWHPNIFFEKILVNLQKKYNFSFKIISTHYTSKKCDNILWKKEFDNIAQTNKVLLCDDVLTTGTSSKKTLKVFEKYIKNDSWDLFTIFRSPQG